MAKLFKLKNFFRGWTFVFFFLNIEFAFAQEKILYTYVDYKLGEVRAALLTTENNERLDLGFNKTYLPAWLGDKILFNGQNYIWLCNDDGSDLQKIGDGYRVSVSQKKNLFAFYSKNGISIYDSSLTFIKEIEVEAWSDVSITWIHNDSAFTYYNLQKQMCYLYFIYKDSVAQFGSHIYHPLQYGSELLFNKMEEDGIFAVYNLKSGEPLERAKRISGEDEMAVVPMWMNSSKKICYLRVMPDSLQKIQSDMFRCELILYDTEKSSRIILASDASFTDQAFPQFSFSQNDEHIFYTAIVENGNGIIKKINLQSFETEELTKDFYLDERFPICK